MVHGMLLKSVLEGVAVARLVTRSRNGCRGLNGITMYRSLNVGLIITLL